MTGSYYWSYAACQIPAAWLATKFGFRRVFGFSMLVGEMHLDEDLMLISFTLAQVASLITLVFPVAARYSVNLALAARLVLGWFCHVFFGLHSLFLLFLTIFSSKM